jgi:hypothetical protein
MRSNISRRLSQLEQKAHIHDPPQPVIFVTFVSPEGPCQSRQAECDDRVWERTPRETEEDFQSSIPNQLVLQTHVIALASRMRELGSVPVRTNGSRCQVGA